MSRTRRTRTAAILTLAALLAIGPEAFAAGRQTRPRSGQRQLQQRSSVTPLLARGWARLISAWLGEGGIIEPDGRRTTSTPTIPPPVTVPIAPIG